MLTKIAEIVRDICNADEQESLHQAIQTGVETLGFATYNLSCHKKTPLEFMTDPTLTSWSQKDLVTYESERWQDRDPLLAYAARPGLPKAWTPDDWRSSTRYGEYAEYLDQESILSGVTAPLAYKQGLISAITTLSFSATRQTNESATAIYIVGQAAMFRADAIGLSQVSTDSYVKPFYDLTELQIEILDWAAKGKSNGDIAVITNRTRRVINYHMSEILRKMNVASRGQAIAIYSSSKKSE